MSDLSEMNNEDLVFATEDAHFRTIGGCSPEEGAKHMNLRAELLRRLNRKPKALEWHDENGDLTADGVIGPYYIRRREYIGYSVSYPPVGAKTSHASHDIAKAAAQAHHEAELAKWFEESPNA